VRLGLISLGEWSDGLQRKSSNLLPTTKQRGYNSVVECFLAKENVVGSNPTTRSTNKENRNGAVTVLILVVVLLCFIDKSSK
jgi:hypothetical protein